MLVMTRRPLEVIRIGDNIIIQVVELRNGACRIGVTAPKDVAIWRDEIYQAIQRSQRPASPAGKGGAS